MDALTLTPEKLAEEMRKTGKTAKETAVFLLQSFSTEETIQALLSREGYGEEDWEVVDTMETCGVYRGETKQILTSLI